MGGGVARVTDHRGQHAAVLGFHGADDFAWGAGVQLRPVHSRWGYSPLQTAMGRCGRAAAVAPVRPYGTEGHPLTGRSVILLGTATVASPSARDREFPRSPAGPLLTMTGWRHQTPVHSPLSVAA